MTRQVGPNRHQTEIEAMKADGTYDLYTLQYDFAESLVQQMKRLGLNQAELARKVGVSAPYISRVLLGECNFTFETLVKFARALDCKVQVGLEPAHDTQKRTAKVAKKSPVAGQQKKSTAAPDQKSASRRAAQRPRK